MTSRSRSLTRLAAALLATSTALARAQDVPLYRDPSPTEGPRIEGPILPPRPSVPPPPASRLGPFQPPSPDLGPSTAAPPPPEPLREPLLGVPPMPPPLPALPMPPMSPGGDVAVKRTTKIQGPKGVLGHFHDWFRDLLFGPSRAQVASNPPRRGFLGFINRPAWPAWPLADRR